MWWCCLGPVLIGPESHHMPRILLVENYITELYHFKSFRATSLFLNGLMITTFVSFLGKVTVCFFGVGKSHLGSHIAQSCPTLCDPVDFSLPGSSIHGILQAIILEWVTISFSKGSSQPRDRTQVSCIGGRRFNL